MYYRVRHIGYNLFPLNKKRRAHGDEHGVHTIKPTKSARSQKQMNIADFAGDFNL